jgi:hypothetical protein
MQQSLKNTRQEYGAASSIRHYFSEQAQTRFFIGLI